MNKDRKILNCLVSMVIVGGGLHLPLIAAGGDSETVSSKRPQRTSRQRVRDPRGWRGQLSKRVAIHREILAALDPDGARMKTFSRVTRDPVEHRTAGLAQLAYKERVGTEAIIGKLIKHYRQEVKTRKAEAKLNVLRRMAVGRVYKKLERDLLDLKRQIATRAQGVDRGIRQFWTQYEVWERMLPGEKGETREEFEVRAINIAAENVHPIGAFGNMGIKDFVNRPLPMMGFTLFVDEPASTAAGKRENARLAEGLLKTARQRP